MIIPILLASDGTPQIWLDSADRQCHDASSGTDVPRSLTEVESARLDTALILGPIFTQLKTLIGSVELITTQAEQDITMAETRQGQIEDWQTATTAHAGVIRSILTPTVAQIKEELAVACERDVIIAGQLINAYQWRSLVDQLLELLAQCVAGLARLATRTTSGAS